MDRTDTTIALIGAGILVLAIAGSALTGATQRAEETWNVHFVESKTSLEPQTSTITASGEAFFDVPIGKSNVTRIVFTAKVSAFSPHVANDEFVLFVTAPNGTETSVTARASEPVISGTPVVATLVVDLALADLPSPYATRARTAEQALGAVNDTTVEENWRVVVRVTHGSPEPTARHPITLESSVTSYEGKVSRPASPK